MVAPQQNWQNFLKVNKQLYEGHHLLMKTSGRMVSLRHLSHNLPLPPRFHFLTVQLKGCSTWADVAKARDSFFPRTPVKSYNTSRGQAGH